jgi:hypothetical protein
VHAIVAGDLSEPSPDRRSNAGGLGRLGEDQVVEVVTADGEL